MDTPWLQVLAALAALVLPLLVAWVLIAHSARSAEKKARAKMRS